MKVAFWLFLLSFAMCGCHPRDPVGVKDKTIKTKQFTESDACKALLRDLKISADSELGKSLFTDRFSRDEDSGICIIETKKEQFSFNLNEMSFRIVKGIDPKTGAPHVIRGEFFISETGELKARF